MDLFSGTELAFGDSYFTPRNPNIIRITTDLPVKTIAGAEVIKSAGSFSSIERGLQNRFIIWRAEGANLHMNEYSIDKDLIDSSLCINFSASLIIPGTRLFIVRRKIFLIVVPTQSGIHRFYVHLDRNQDDSLGNVSILSRLHQYGELYATHDFNAWKSPGIAIFVSVGTDQNGSTKAVVRMLDGPVLRVIYPSLSPMETSIPEEYPFQDVGMLESLFKKKTIGIFDAAVVTGEFGVLRIFSASHDGKLRILDVSSGNVISCFDLIAKMSVLSCQQIEDISLRVVQPSYGRVGESEFVLVNLLLSGINHFTLLKQIGKDITVCFSSSLNQVYIKDFTARVISPNNTNINNEKEKFCLWVIVNESPEVWDSDEELQPYTLMKCEFISSLSAIENQEIFSCAWESVRPASSSCVTDNRLFKYPNSEGIRNRIFDGNNYSFDVVSRAVQVVCKQQQHLIQYGNWIALSRFLDEFLSSGQLKNLYFIDAGDPIDDTELLPDETKLKQSYEKFWMDFLKTCDQLQEESLEPLAIWQSEPIGLIGVVQKCRFTTYLPPDDQMLAICTPQNKIAKLIFDLVRQNTMSHLSNPDKISELVNNNTDELCRLISSFGVRTSPLLTKNPCKIIKFRSHFLQSNFTVSLIAMAIRSIVLARLKISCIINSLVEVIPQILASSSEDRIDPRIAMVISTYNSRIAQSINYYTTLWIALSVRLFSHDNIPKQINVAQAFLKYGTNDKFVMAQRPTCREDDVNEMSPDRIMKNNLEEDDLDDSEIIENGQIERLIDEDEQFDDGEYITQDDDVSYSSNIKLLPPPSRWDDTIIQKSRKSQKLQQNQQSSFCRFFADLIEGMLIVLWPESKTLTLPCFLAESNFFDALKNYCTLNEPFPSELAYSFEFFQAIACSGQNKPETAWTMFQEISKGVENGDLVFNELLSKIYPSPSVNLTLNNNENQNNGFPIDERTLKKNKHSLIEYFNKVMFIFKEHKHYEYVVLAGKLAVNYAKSDRDDLLLSEVYTTLFTQHLLTKTYWEAVRSVLHNPNNKRRSVCLFQLITHLLDTRQTKILVALPYGNLADMVVEILEARCKAEMIVSGIGNSSMYNIAYAFHISRCEYTKAAKLMYELSMRLRREIQDRALLQRRCNTLATIFQTMQIVELKDDEAMLIWDDIDENENENREESPGGDFEFVDANGNINNNESDLRQNPNKIKISKSDVSRELLKLEARLALMDADPTIVPPLEEAGILYESLRYKRYDMAWLLIKEFGLKPNDLLAQITEEAIRIDNSEDNTNNEINYNSQQNEEKLPEWVFCNRSFIRDLSIGGNQEPHWRIVISYLDLSLKIFQHDSSILRTIANTFLKFSIKLPVWLVKRYSEINFGDLLRLLIDFGDFADAFDVLLVQIETIKKRLMEKTTKQIILDPLAKNSESQLEMLSLLPLPHIEMLLQLAEKDENRINFPIAETTTKLKEFYAYNRVISRNPVNI